MQVGDTVTVVTISGEYVGEPNHSKTQLWFLKHEWLFKQKRVWVFWCNSDGKENPEEVKFLM